jgi:hypothetical protein
MAIFPSIRPTRRNFSLGEYPLKTYRSLSGKTVRRSFGNRPFNATLELGFENVKENVLEAIYNHYHGQDGGTIGFALPSVVFAGLPAGNLVNQLIKGDPYVVNGTIANKMEWLYVESPKVESVYRNLSNISVTLVAEFIQ